MKNTKPIKVVKVKGENQKSKNSEIHDFLVNFFFGCQIPILKKDISKPIYQEKFIQDFVSKLI